MTLTEISNLTVTDKENQGQQQVKAKKNVPNLLDIYFINLHIENNCFGHNIDISDSTEISDKCVEDSESLVKPTSGTKKTIKP